MTIGTAGYMSPEQLTDAPVGPASDVFALGAVLAYTATGAGPFGVGSPHALHYRTVHEHPNLQTLPSELHDIVAACLAKQADRRPTLSDLLRYFASPPFQRTRRRSLNAPAHRTGLDASSRCQVRARKRWNQQPLSATHPRPATRATCTTQTSSGCWRALQAEKILPQQGAEPHASRSVHLVAVFRCRLPPGNGP
ncbi:protein kinase domain-containing protein [Streptomyces griseorubiginosus]|uniref:protein kinase domain-containing protein n=1 Tax=Streptomyces griseorubiginosus TaxID=67304 RepID=UPI003649617A